MAIRIITDSASDLTPDQARAKSVTVVPLSIQFGPDSYFDGISITKDNFYQLLLAGKHHPTTAQPSPEAFLQYFEEAKTAGDQVICISLASQLSGTFQSANIAKGLCDYDGIYLIDSESATGGMQILIDLACKRREQGAAAAEIAAELEALKPRIRIYAVIDTLEYLYKGGRLSAASAVVGTAVRLKPILDVRHGQIHVASKAFGSAAAEKQLTKLIAEHPFDENYPVFHLYSDSDERKAGFVAALTEKGLLSASPDSCQLGATLGTHVGPGALGLAYIAAEE